MAILEYIKSLVTVIKKPAVLEDIHITEQELKQKVIPVWVEAEKQFRGKNALGSSEALEMSKTFGRITGSNPRDMVDSIVDRLKKLQGILVLARTLVERTFEETTVADGMTIMKINMVKIVDSAGFISRYSLHFLNYLYIVETAMKMEDPNYIKDHLSVGQMQWINDNFLTYCQLVSKLCVNEKQAEKLIEGMPDAVLGLDPSAVTSMLGDKTVNPMGIMGFSPTSSNPIYHIRLFIAEYQTTRYSEAVELKTVLELRLLNLKRKQDGQFDARTEREIEVTQSRVDGLSEKIRQAEESVK